MGVLWGNIVLKGYPVGKNTKNHTKDIVDGTKFQGSSSYNERGLIRIHNSQISKNALALPEITLYFASFA